MMIYLHSLGCDKNLVDSEIMLGLLYESGCKIEADPSQADVIVINTCGFIREAVEEGIETVLEFAGYKKEGRCSFLIVTGCMAQRYKNDIMAEIPEVDAILGVNDFPKIADIINRRPTNSIDVLDDQLFQKRINTMPMHVTYIKISEGCDNRCTYCTIPDIRGPYRDRKFESITAECERMVKNGSKELVLVAQDTAKYGTNLYGRQRLHELLESIANLDDLGWVRVMYAYPEHIYPDLINVIASHEKICSYLDMPIQHSDQAVLARMGRKIFTLNELISQLKGKGIAIRTTLIAGFPGETEEEYENLRSFVEASEFNHLGVFAYSREEGTPAAGMKPQIKTSVKKNRVNELMTLQAKIAEKNNKTLVDRTLKVMVDGSIEDGGGRIYSGRSQKDAYEIDGSVFFSSDMEWMSGDFVDVKITKAHGYDLYGTL